MRKLFLIAVLFVFLGGCCTCPSDTRYIFMPQLGNFIKFPPGFFDDEDNTYSEKEYQDVLKEWQKNLNDEWEKYKKSLLKDDREI